MGISDTARISYGKIDHFLLIGGGFLLGEFAVHLKKKGYQVNVFVAKRHVDEVISDEGFSFKELLEKNKIEYHSPRDINEDEVFIEAGNRGGMGIGFGETWSFTKRTTELFNGRLLDVMGIRLPQYRGGAHYTWQILRKNKVGACNLQLINEEMIQGEYDSGKIVKSAEYLFSSKARIPKDYFKEAIGNEFEFLKEFVEELESGRSFNLFPVPESFSIFFPRLHTKSQAYIDWSWKTDEIETFICAFDDPYPGSSTFLNNKRVFLKGCQVEYNDGPFHPFQVGLIYRIDSNGVYIGTKNGTLIVQVVLGENGENLIRDLKVGDRFYTPRKNIEDALQFRADYDSNGLKC